MRKYILAFAGLLGCLTLHAQTEITEENYLRADSALWLGYEARWNELNQMAEAHPEKKDSLREAFAAFESEVNEKNRELAKMYASVPSGLQRLYMVRLQIPKDTLRRVLNRIPLAMKESVYGRYILEHIQTRQIEAGSEIVPFPCVTSEGEPFDWEGTKGKALLLLYGGLGCMGEEGRKALEEIFRRQGKEEFLVIVYWPAETLEGLKEVKEYYSKDYVFISDFKEDGSPMKIRYGAQAMPTCFLTDKSHVVKVKCEGLRVNEFKPYLAR